METIGTQEFEEIVETEGADHSPANDLGEAPDFTAEWEEIREDLESEFERALRIGQNLIKIRKALKPLKLWGQELARHGMSQPQASRYIRFAEMPEHERIIFQREKGFSVSRAVGERDRRKGAAEPDGDRSSTNGPAEAEVPEDEQLARLAEVEQLVTLALKVVEAGESALREESVPAESDDERWNNRLGEVVDAVHTVLAEHLAAELRERLLRGRS